MASAFLAMPRGSRLYGSPVVGSSTSQVMTMVVSAKNGSIVAVTGSGIRHMSDSLIAFQPAIDEPSNMVPSAKISSSIMLMSKVTCCHLPRGSVKRRSTYFTSLSLIDFRTSLAVFMNTPFGYYGLFPGQDISQTIDREDRERNRLRKQPFLCFPIAKSGYHPAQI